MIIRRYSAASAGTTSVAKLVGRANLHFADKRFVETIIGSDIDYLIWYSPFKHFESDMPELPTVCVYDVKQIDLSNFEEYPQSLIMSTES